MVGVTFDNSVTVYLASSFSLRDRVQFVCDSLETHGFAVPDQWWHDADGQADLKEIDKSDDLWYQDERVIEKANQHWSTINVVDAFVLVAPAHDTKKFNGANIELGYAIANDLPCFAVGRLERSAMYQPVTQVGNSQQLIDELGELDRALAVAGETV